MRKYNTHSIQHTQLSHLKLQPIRIPEKRTVKELCAYCDFRDIETRKGCPTLFIFQASKRAVS